MNRIPRVVVSRSVRFVRMKANDGKIISAITGMGGSRKDGNGPVAKWVDASVLRADDQNWL